MLVTVSPGGLFRVEGGDSLPPSCLNKSFMGCWGDTDGKSPSDSVFFAAEVDAGSGSSAFSRSCNEESKGLLICV